MYLYIFIYVELCLSYYKECPKINESAAICAVQCWQSLKNTIYKMARVHSTGICISSADCFLNMNLVTLNGKIPKA